jgi:hypothetical protein
MFTASSGLHRRVGRPPQAPGRGSNGAVSSAYRTSPIVTPSADAIASARRRASPIARAALRSRSPTGAKPTPDTVMPGP